MSGKGRARPAEERLRRLLVMLPWLMERESVPLSEVATRFGLSEDEVAADLELVSMCGLPPFVDELIDLFIDDGTVYVGVPRLFTRPLRLNSREAFELVTAGRAAMELPGADPTGPLGRGLTKLANALDEVAGLGDDVTVDLERPSIADTIADAARRLEWLRVRYWSASRDESTVRRIVPLQMFVDRGNWYVTARDDRSDAVRTFRLDRIESWESTGEFADASDDPLPEPGRWFLDAEVPRATLRLAPAGRWVVERYPIDEVSGPDHDGWSTVTMPLASERWFERLVVRLGPDVVVMEPAHLRDTGRAAAERMLARYGRS
jgi:proteasome accessory factor C